MNRGKKTEKKKPVSYEKEYIDSLRKDHEYRCKSQKSFRYEDGNEKQKLGWRIFKKFVDEYTENKPGIKLVIPGSAGTGKSSLLDSFCDILDEKGLNYIVCSFTGSSAFPVRGYTFHHIFNLNLCFVNSEPREVDFSKPVIQRLARTKFYFFDEMSLISLHLLGFISERLKFIHGNEQDFGGCSVVMLGDFFQLPSVASRPLYKQQVEDDWKPLEVIGRNLYRSFDKVVFLTENMRQNSPNEETFRRLLLRIRRGILEPDDHKLLSQRYIGNLTDEEAKKFEDSETVCLFSPRKPARIYNELRVRNLGTPVVDVYPIDSKTCPGPMHFPLPLAVGARIMLNINVSIPCGLYNGSLHTVTEIPAPIDGGKYHDVIFAKPDVFYGRPYNFRCDLPFIRRHSTMTDDLLGISWGRQDFSIDLAFGLTVYRVQGLGLKRCLIWNPPDNHSRRDPYYRASPTLTYTAASRVPTLDRLAFRHPFRSELIEAPNSRRLREMLDEEERLQQIEASMFI